MKNVIGIISYLPDEKDKRDSRLKLLFALLSKCHEIFNLPIIIVAQNWKSELVRVPWATIYRYDNKLGIVGARRELRRLFLESAYDNLIMLDDDCIISGDKYAGNQYLMQIENHPGMFYEFNSSLLKLFAINRELLKQQDFRDINPETGDGFEDRVFVSDLRKKFPEKRFILQHNKLEELSTSTKDPLSTWYTNQDINEMLENTLQYMD